MSSMTVGGNMKLPPSRLVLRFSFLLVDGATAGAFFSLAMIFTFASNVRGPQSVDQFLFRGLQIVVVPELAAGHVLLDVLDAVGRAQAVHLHLAGQPRDVEIGLFTGRRI